MSIWPSQLGLPTPELLGSIAGGAHYAGALARSTSLSPTRDDPQQLRPRLKAHNRRRSVDDPSVEDVFKEVMQDLEELYCGRPTLEILQRRWHQDAVFEDPLCKCKGFNEFAPQWFALPKIFPKSERVSTRVISAALGPNELVYQQTQEYTVRWLRIKKSITSIITVEFDEELKIIRLVDRWNGDEPPTHWGALGLRRLNAKLTPLFVSIPKNRK
ncbi:hypothetical protein B0H21DRAFT_874525 [Amylocystis lapponica]|nr:hypothetical protein B0H21DRAFT_874525 [Amylocystis lapponica]